MPARLAPIATACLAVAIMAVAGAMTVSPQPAQADPIRWTLEGWKTDFDKTSVDLARILSGGPPRDGIPSIDDPAFEPVADHDGLVDVDPVVGLTINGDARAYPLEILTWHEIVNDVVGGVPVAVTYCPLCNSAPVFERTVGDQVLEFGTTGKLKDSNLIMYDRTTETWWQQFTGDAIVGAMTGAKLTLVPARLQSWAQFRADNPAGQVLIPNNDRMRNYGRNPYVSYDSSRPFLYDGQLPPDIDPMERVVVVPRDDAGPLIVAMNAVAETGAYTAQGVTLQWTAGQASALDTARISDGRDVGTVLVTRDGADVPYDVTFAFVAHAFHPGVAIMRQ